MEVSETEVDDILVLKVMGRLDAASSPLLERRLTSILDGDRLKLVMDFEGVEYLSSAGMRLLLNVMKKLKARQGKLVIASVNEDVMEVISMAGFDHILEIRDTQQDAVAAF